MKVIRPSTWSTDLLISHNYTEFYPEWDIGTAYLLGDTVVRGDLGTYESLSSNTGDVPETTPLSWLRTGPTNKLAMVDSQISTISSNVGGISFTVKVGSITSIGLLNLIGESATLTITDGLGGPILFGPVIRSLQGTEVLDWYDYFYFDVTDQRTQAVFPDLPYGIENAHAVVEIGGTGITSIGAFIFGVATYIGKAEYGFSSGITDYSTKETDEFGNTIFIVREFNKRITVELQVENFNLNKVQRILYSLRATPALWIATEDARYEESAIVYGFYRDFTTTIPYPTISKCALEIEGLI